MNAFHQSALIGGKIKERDFVQITQEEVSDHGDKKFKRID